MNPPPDRERLLDDVLAESAPADFRDELLGETLRLARGRRRVRQIRRASVVLAVGCLVGILVWRNLPPRGGQSRPVVAGGEVIRTQPLPAAAIVRTQPFGAGRVVGSIASVTVIRTEPAGRWLHLLNDDELLAFAAPQPAALVRVGPHAQELIFIKTAEQGGPPLN